MPTYDYRCRKCGVESSVFQSIGEYTRSPKRPTHCGDEMDRRLAVVPAMSALANALAGDRHYDGLRASDGTDISTRTKHREYMRRNDLAMAEDFKDTWAKAAKEREALRTAKFQDKELRETIAQSLHESVNRSE